MRLPVVPGISTKDGTSNKNARLTNMLKERRKAGDLAVIRPGLEVSAASTGNGNGLVAFNGELVSVYGATLGLNTGPESIVATVGESYTDAYFYAALYVNGEFVVLAYDALEDDNFWANGDGSMLGAQNYIGNNNAINDAATNGTEIAFCNDVLMYSDLSSVGSYSFSMASYSVPLLSPTFDRVSVLNGKFVALANQAPNSAVLWSDDSATWDSSASLSGVLYGALYDESVYRFYGASQLIGGTPIGYSTTDFTSFSSMSVSFPVGVSLIYRAAYIGGKYLCYAYDGVNIGLYISDDGLTFTAASASNVTTFNNANNMLVVSGAYAYVLADPSPTDPSNSHVFRTSDGVTWIDYASLTPSDISSLAIGPSSELGTYPGEYWYPIFDHGTGEATIPALAAVPDGRFDFAQSPL